MKVVVAKGSKVLNKLSGVFLQLLVLSDEVVNLHDSSPADGDELVESWWWVFRVTDPELAGRFTFLVNERYPLSESGGENSDRVLGFDRS